MRTYPRAFRKPLRPTVAQYQQLAQLQKHQALDDFDREIRFAAIMTNKTIQQAEEELTMAEIMDINQRYEFPDMSTVVPRLPKRVWIRGRLYKISPNFTKLNAGEFVSFQHFTRTPWIATKNLHNVMALLIRPYRIPYILPARKIEKPDTYLERAKFLQDHAPAWIGCMISAFFLQVWNRLSASTPGSKKKAPNS